MYPIEHWANGETWSSATMQKLPVFVKDLLPYGPKHPFKHKFNDTQFLEDIDNLVNNLRQNGVNGDKLCEVEASAKMYAKNQRENRWIEVCQKWLSMLKYMTSKQYRFLKVFKGFCVKRKSTYQTNSNQALDCPQFSRIDASDDIIEFQSLKKTLTAFYWNWKDRSW